VSNVGESLSITLNMAALAHSEQFTNGENCLQLEVDCNMRKISIITRGCLQVLACTKIFFTTGYIFFQKYKKWAHYWPSCKISRQSADAFLRSCIKKEKKHLQ